ncbi:hypothetical protein [Capnocytophaga bilenii]
MKKYVLLALSLIFTFGCAQQKSNKDKQFCYNILDNIEKDMNQTLQKMKTTNNKAKNDLLLDGFYDRSKKNFELLSQEKMVKAGLLNDTDEDVLKHSALPELNKVLEKYHLDVVHFKSDISSLTFKRDFIYNTFRNYVSEEAAAYYKIEGDYEECDRREVFLPGGYFEPIDEFHNLLLEEGNFIKKYPNNKRTPKLIERFKDNITGYLTEGIFINDSDYSKKEIQKFINTHPDTPAAKIIKSYKKDMEEDQLDKIIYREIGKSNKDKDLKAFENML